MKHRGKKHTTMTNNTEKINIPRHPRINPYTLKTIISGAGLTDEEFKKLLWSMKKPSYTIYMLVDPRDHKPFYIGQTQYPYLRYKEHRNPSDDDKSDRAKRIREIRKSRKSPLFVELESTNRKTSALIKEMFWIELFKSRGMKLKNQENQKWLLKQYDELLGQMKQARAWSNHPLGGTHARVSIYITSEYFEGRDSAVV